MMDFCTRIDLRTSNKRVLENLICAGALDSFPGNRAQKFDNLQQILEQAVDIKKERTTGQMSLFNSGKKDLNDISYDFPHKNDWSDKEKLEKEKEVIGFYISSHPLHSYTKQLSWIGCQNLKSILDLMHQAKDSSEIMILTCGMIESKKEIMTKKGDKMAFLQIADQDHHAEVIVFPKTFQKVSHWLNTHSIFIIKGAVDMQSPQSCKIKAAECIPLDLFFDEWKKFEQIQLTLPETITNEQLAAIKAQLPKGSVPLSFIFQEDGKIMQLKTDQKIQINAKLLHELSEQEINIHIVL